MHSRQADIGKAHDRFLAPVTAQNDLVAAQECAVCDLFAAAEAPRPRDPPVRELARDVVVFIKNGDIVFALVEVDVLLCRDVFGHVLVHVQMIRRKVCQYRNVR